MMQGGEDEVDNDVETEIRAQIGEFLGYEDIDVQRNLTVVGADSSGLVEILGFIKDRFQVDISAMTSSNTSKTQSITEIHLVFIGDLFSTQWSSRVTHITIEYKKLCFSFQ